MDDIKSINKIKKQNNKIILEIALSINRELFNEERIPYKMFKYTENQILNQIKSIK